MIYSIIDIETTGLNARKDRITEIAVIVHDGEKIIDRFETLVNPECRIPYNITALTSISNKMVSDAPVFCEIARKIVEITENTTIVAHNAAFDYNFIRFEFKRLFYDFNRRTICTKRLSRKLLPGMNSYGLGSLCKSLGIINHARHRAGGDALATTMLLEYLLKIENDIVNLPLKGLHSSLPKEEILNLPESPGVYYFLDEHHNLLYIGKSVNIKNRVLSHLHNNISKRELELLDRIAQVNFELTGSDLVASLLESSEIKKHKPVFNRLLRRSSFRFGLYSYSGTDGYIRLGIEAIKGERLPLTSYGSREEGRKHLVHLVGEYKLCQKLCNIYKSNGPCFDYHIGACRGACKGEEPVENYNDRVIDAIGKYSYRDKNFLIIDDGRRAEELSVVKVENGKYIGFGYVDIDALQADSSVLHDTIKSYEDNRDAHVILRGYLRKNKFERMVIY